MLLVLFLIGIGTAIPQVPPPPKVVKSPEIIGMKTAPVRKQFLVDASALTSGDSAAKRATCAAVKKAFSKQLARQDRAAFVLIFGGGADPGPAGVLAEKVYPQLKCASAQLFPAGTIRRTYWDGKIRRDDVRVEVFLYTTKKAR